MVKGRGGGGGQFGYGTPPGSRLEAAGIPEGVTYEASLGIGSLDVAPERRDVGMKVYYYSTCTRLM